MLRISLLGGVRIDHPHRALPPIRITRALQALLSYLVLERHRCHPREVLSGLFWGDQPEERARACLNTALWRLRRLLEPPGVARGTYLLNTAQGEVGFNIDSAHWVDVAELEDAAAFVLRRPIDAIDPQQVPALDSALQLYRGELLEGVYADWAVAERDRVHGIYLDSLLALTRYFNANGAPDRSLAYAQRILRYDALREEVHCEVMRAYLTTGQRALARQQYETCRRLLMTELGAEPLAETQALGAELGASRGAPVIARRAPRRGPSPVTTERIREILEGLQHVCMSLEAALRDLDDDRRAGSPAPRRPPRTVPFVSRK